MSVTKGHSVPVPRIYKEAASIRKKINEGHGLNELIYNCKHRNVKGIYSLVCTSLRNDTLLSTIVEKSEMITEKFDPDLAKILVTELLWGKKQLPGDSKPVQVVLAHRSKLLEAVDSSDIPVTLESVIKPRYVRVNTLLATVEGTTQRFVDDGWDLMDTPESYEDFVRCITDLDENQFMHDYHFEDLLVFPAKSELFNHKLVENGSLILQDKASCLPAVLLNPEPDSVVLDMCAAPGLKTSHLASLMKNKGTLHAVDMNQKRYEIMVNQIKSYCGVHSCVKCQLVDAAHLSSQQYPGVQYILVDPSCSGTGMSKRIEDCNDANGTVDSKRIQRLANFQERLLVQALTAFPDVERVVYSTCSVLEEENEKVIERVLARVPSFHVVSPVLKTDWKRRGNTNYSFGSACLVANVESDLTNGFFVAVLERVSRKVCTPEKSRKRKSDVTDDGWEFPKKKKKGSKKAKQMEISDEPKNEDNNNDDDAME